MTTIKMPSTHTLSDAYVDLQGPEAYDASRHRFIQYLGQDEAFLVRFHARPERVRRLERAWNVAHDGPEPDFGPTLGRDEPFDHVKALREYWASTEYVEEVSSFRGREGVVWPCKPMDPARAATLMRLHAPMVAYTLSGNSGETVGLSLRRVSRRRIQQVTAGVLSIDDDMQILIAYLCCGFLPPRGLVLKGLKAGLPMQSDPGVLAGIEVALDSIGRVVDAAKVSLAG